MHMKCSCCHDLEVMSSNPGRVELGVYFCPKPYLNQTEIDRYTEITEVNLPEIRNLNYR